MRILGNAKGASRHTDNHRLVQNNVGDFVAGFAGLIHFGESVNAPSISGQDMFGMLLNELTMKSRRS